MMTEQRFDVWTSLWGTLDWEGVFAPENLTYEAEGNDPTGGNPYRISRSAFIEGKHSVRFITISLQITGTRELGYPNTTYIAQSAPEFMIEQVFKYPGKVSIYAAGSPTNVAAAIRTNDTFASTAKELVIMGGYVDLNLMQVQGDLGENLGSDINFIVDPEAAHIALTANWPSITIAGNIANTQYLTQDIITQITTQSPNLYSDLLKVYYTGFPLWDETAGVSGRVRSGVVTESMSASYDYGLPGCRHQLGGGLHGRLDCVRQPLLRRNVPLGLRLCAEPYTKGQLRHRPQYDNILEQTD